MSSRRRLAPHERRFVQLLVAAWLGVLTTYLMVIADAEGGTAAAALISGVLAVRLAWGPFTKEYPDDMDLSEWLRCHENHYSEWFREDDDAGRIVAAGVRCHSCQSTLRFDHPDEPTLALIETRWPASGIGIRRGLASEGG